MTTWIDIVDTTVKIGLGALITAISGWLIIDKRYKKEFDQRKFERNRELLEEVASNVESFSNSYRKYSLVAFNICKRAAAGGEIDIEALDEHTKLHKAVHDQTQSLSSAQSLLYLIGEEIAHNKLIDYIYLTEECLIKTEKPSRSIDLDELATLRDRIIEEKKAFFGELSKIYDGVGF